MWGGNAKIIMPITIAATVSNIDFTFMFVFSLSSENINFHVNPYFSRKYLLILL